MERLLYRSTSLMALQAEMRQRDLLREAELPRAVRPSDRARSLPFGLSLLRRHSSR